MTFINAQLTVLRRFGQRVLSTPVEIWRRTTTETDFGSAESWSLVSTELGWLRQTNTGVLGSDAGRLDSLGEYVLRLSASATAKIGDRVVIGDEEFMVVDTNVENTYRVFTNLTLRRRQ